MITLLDERGDGSEIAFAAQPFEAGLFVEQGVDLIGGQFGHPVQVHHDAGIDVAAAGSCHDQPLQRGHPHRRVDRLPAADRRRRRPVTQVQHDLIELGKGLPRNRQPCPTRTVTGAVKP